MTAAEAPQPGSPFDNYLDILEAAAELDIHPHSVRRLIKQKRIPAISFAGKYLIERSVFNQFRSLYNRQPGRKWWPLESLTPAGHAVPPAPPRDRPLIGDQVRVIECGRHQFGKQHEGMVGRLVSFWHHWDGRVRYVVRIDEERCAALAVARVGRAVL